MYEISSASIPTILDFDSQALGNTAWAFALLTEFHDKTLMHAIAVAAITLGSDLHVQSQMGLMDVYGTCDFAGVNLLAQVHGSVAGFVQAGYEASGWRPGWSVIPLK